MYTMEENNDNYNRMIWQSHDHISAVLTIVVVL